MKKIVMLVMMVFLTAEFASAKNLKGLLHSRTTLAPINISAGEPLATEPYKLEAGKYYKLVLKSDGSREVPIVGAAFFRNIWVINLLNSLHLQTLLLKIT